MKGCIFFAGLFHVIAFAFGSLQSIPEDTDKCTTIIVGPGASPDGILVTHTADCADCDFRMNKVPRRKHAEGSERKIYIYKNDYPAMITEARGETWKVSNLEGTSAQKAAWGTESEIVTTIPEVEETYALIEAGYGIMNEHQLAMGESTCASKLYAFPPSHGGKARIEVSEMSRIALERTKTAQDAIKLMGKLAVELGFYAADFSGGDASKGEGGEALTVIDPNEAWVFHVLADDTGTSAVWVAQRVPPGHVAAVANSFVIRKIKKDSPDFMYSDNIFEVAKRAGFWDGKGELDFLPTFAPMRTHSIYSTRRVWRVFDYVAPSLQLPGDTDAFANDYPFSVPVDKPVHVQDIMNLNRDHYEGTKYDMTKGVAGGPYGDPARFDVSSVDGMTMEEALDGSFERSISIFRTSYSFVAVARKNIPTNLLSMIWFGQYQPSTSNYVPVYVAADAARPLTRGSLFKFDNEIPFWNYLVVNNYASRFYNYAIGDIKALQKRVQDMSFKAVKDFEQSVMKLIEAEHEGNYYAEKYGGVTGLPELSGKLQAKIVDLMNGLSIWQAEAVSGAWRDYFPQLVTKIHDGYWASDLDQPDIKMNKMFYPKWWLKVTGYFKERPNPMGPDTILFDSSPLASDGQGGDQTRTESVGFVSFLLVAGLVILSGALGFRLGKGAKRGGTDVDIQGGADYGLAGVSMHPLRQVPVSTSSTSTAGQHTNNTAAAVKMPNFSLTGARAHKYEQI